MSNTLNINHQLYEKNYSLVGKISLQKYPIILQKNKIMTDSHKKHRIKDLFTPDDPKKDDKMDEYDTLLNKYQLTIHGNKNYNKKKKSKLEFRCIIMKNNPKLIYHNKHLYNGEIKKRINIGADTFSYAPKYDYIKPRLLSGPKWKSSEGRKQKKIDIDIRNYYMNRIDFVKNADSKCLVNMNKTTQRGDFLTLNNFKARNAKCFNNNEKVEKKKANKKKKKNKPLFINIPQNEIKNKNSKDIIISHTTRNKNNSNDTAIFHTYSYKNLDKFSKTYNNFNIKLKSNKIISEEEKSKKIKEREREKEKQKQKNNSSSNNRNDKLNNTETIKYNNIINNFTKNSAPDFGKIISREQVKKAKGEDFHKIPFIIPNYSLVRERSLAMAIYKKRKKEKINTRAKYMEGIDYKIKYDPDKIMDKCNNHINIAGPNFNYMLTRDVSQKCSLPSYMRNIYDRGSIYRITEKTLRLNKYKEGKLTPATSSFLPKRSYNKIININLIKSHTFKEKVKDEYINEKKENLKTEIERKNNEEEIEFLKDLGALTQFENFTYKSIPSDRKKKNYNKNWIKQNIKNIISIY